MNNQELKLQAVFDNIPDGLLMVKPTGDIEYANEVASSLFGYEQEDFINFNINQLLTLDHSNDQVISLKFSNSPLEIQGRNKQGVFFPLLVTVREVKIENEDFYILFLHDLTYQKKEEEKIAKYALELERSNNELKEFAYVSSHDLQEPLRKVYSFGEILMQTESDRLTEEGKDYLTRMSKAVVRMQNLIRDLLSFSRVAIQPVSFELVDLTIILKEVLNDLEVSIEKANAIISYHALPVIEAESTQLRQVFQNIISNALKFRKENERLTINIYTNKEKEYCSERLAEDNQFIEIYFEDNGIGFDEKHVERIFDLFQRLESKKYEGSGIGLAICRKIVMYHGGNIRARSTPGKGSVFIVKLPVKTSIM